jgi:hypothetical protein
MLQLIAESTNRLAFTPSEADSVTLTALVGSEDVDFGTPVQEGLDWVVIVAVADVPAIGSTGTLYWTITKGTQARTVPEAFEVVAYPAIITERNVTDALGAQGVSNAPVLSLVVEATNADVIEELGGFTYPPTDETRPLFADGPTAYPWEMAEITALTTLAGHPVDYTAIRNRRGHIKWLQLTEDVTETLLVTGKWGWATVPDDIRLAALSAAVVRYQRHAFTVDADRIGNLGSLPRQTIEVLHRYRG